MIALPFKVVETREVAGYDRAEVRERIRMLTVRDTTCAERWGDWHSYQRLRGTDWRP